jgi:ABC-2 type transport system ATP-binding protein
VVLSTHHVEEVERLADHIGVLRGGELRAQVSLEDLRRGLRRYQLEVPEGWSGVKSLDSAVVLRRVISARETQWTVWGPEAEITHQFASANATVRDVTQLSLLDATITLLTQQG